MCSNYVIKDTDIFEGLSVHVGEVYSVQRCNLQCTRACNS